MISFRTIFLIALSTLIFAACSDDDDCQDRILNVTSLEAEYGCADTRYQTDIDLADQYTIIRSQAVYDANVTGDCQPAIDFDIYDLVIGKKALTSGNTSIEYQLTRICGMDNLELQVTFYQNETAVAPNLTYHALVPKLGDEEGVDVLIQIIN